MFLRRGPRIFLISIHAPREGGDYVFAPGPHHGKISIHAPREGGDFMFLRRGPITVRFQSTPPARGATHHINDSGESQKFQSTPPARGATLCKQGTHWGNDRFQSTPPARGATVQAGNPLG